MWFNERRAKIDPLFWHSGRDNPHHNITFDHQEAIQFRARWERERPRLRAGLEPRTSGFACQLVSGWAITLLPTKLIKVLFCWGGGDVDAPGWSRLYETVKAVDVFDLLRSGIWLIWRKKVLWVESMLCVLGDPKMFGKIPLLLKKI